MHLHLQWNLVKPSPRLSVPLEPNAIVCCFVGSFWHFVWKDVKKKWHAVDLIFYYPSRSIRLYETTWRIIEVLLHKCECKLTTLKWVVCWSHSNNIQTLDIQHPKRINNRSTKVYLSFMYIWNIVHEKYLQCNCSILHTQYC